MAQALPHPLPPQPLPQPLQQPSQQPLQQALPQQPQAPSQPPDALDRVLQQFSFSNTNPHDVTAKQAIQELVDSVRNAPVKQHALQHVIDRLDQKIA